MLSADAATEDFRRIAGTLALHGVVVVRNFVSASGCAVLRTEFAALLEQAEVESAPTFKRVNRSRFMRVLDTELDRARYPAVATSFYSTQIEQIAGQFYGEHAFRVNPELYLTHDVECMDFNGSWHLDPSRSLKFLLYLNDVDAGNGAMMYVPGSNHHSIYRIHYHRYRGEDEFPVFLPDNEVPASRVSLNGPAGTAVIFDTAGLHRAGELTAGRERMVIRGHCYARPALRERIFNRLRRSKLNPLRLARTEDELVAPEFRSRPRWTVTP
ncbi:MAG: phytanoyl-CoA dioxygenase family protein [Burkholderiales bacterium]